MIRELWNTGRTEADWLREHADLEHDDGPTLTSATAETIVLDLDDESQPVRRLFTRMEAL